MCFPDGPVLKYLPANAGDIREAGLIPGSGNPDPLEKEMATHSSILAWKIPWAEETCGARVHGVVRVRQN